MVTFDNTISLGHLLTGAGFIAAWVGAFYALKGRLISIEASNQAQNRLIEIMQEEIRELSKGVNLYGRLDERLIAMQRDHNGLRAEFTELRHGKGFVQA